MTDPPRPSVAYATPEDVALSFELAGPGARILAALIDQLMLASLQFALLMVVMLAALAGQLISEQQVLDWAEELQTGGPSLVMMAVTLVSGFVVNFAYYISMEMLTNGQTVGKRALGIRVIRDGGYAISLTASLLRNLGRLIDMIPSTYLVGLIAVIAHRQEKRLGDMLAGTVVVRERRGGGAGLPFGDQRYSTLTERRFHLDRAALAALDERHEQVLVQFFSRPRLAREPESRTIHQLSEGIGARLATPPAFADERDRLVFLKEIYLALRERRELG